MVNFQKMILCLNYIKYIKKPPIYLRYVDDILILANNINNIRQDTFQKNSVLNFTHELNKNNKISFLDVLIDI